MYKKYHFNSNSASCGPCQEPAPQVINTSQQCNSCNNQLNRCSCNQLSNLLPPAPAPTCQEGLILTTNENCQMVPLAPVEGRPLTGIVSGGKLKWGIGDAINSYKLEKSTTNPNELKLTSGGNTVSTVTIPASTSPIQSISLNGAPVAPVNGNVNIPGSGGSPIQSISLNGTLVAPSNTGNVNLLVSAGTNGINTVTGGFGITANTVAGATTVGVKTSDWTSNGTATSATQLLGADGKSYKSLDQGELMVRTYSPNGDQSQNVLSTFNWICPPNVTRVRLLMIGGGAGQSGGLYDNVANLAGFQWASGCNANLLEALVSVVPGQTYPIVLGRGGVGAILAANSTVLGTKGEDTTAFGYVCKGGVPPAKQSQPSPYFNLTRTNNGSNTYLAAISPTSFSLPGPAQNGNIQVFREILPGNESGIIGNDFFSSTQSSLLGGDSYKEGYVIAGGLFPGPRYTGTPNYNSASFIGITPPSSLYRNDMTLPNGNKLQNGGGGFIKLEYFYGHTTQIEA